MKELVYHRGFLPAAERWANKVGFYDGDYRATFGQHADRVLRLADAMGTELGLHPGDRFAVLAANSHQFLELYHAAFLGAAIINPLNLRLAGKELQAVLADSGTEVVFVDTLFAEHFARNVAEVRADLPIRHVVLIGEGDVPHDLNYEELVAAGRPNVPDEPEESDPVALMYTGGTTGAPKGVVLDQRSETLNNYHVGMVLGLDESRVYLHQTPMFHAISIVAVLATPSTGGVSVSIPLFEPGQVMDAVERYDVNWTTMVPTMIGMVLDHPDFRPERFGSLRDLAYAGSPMPAGLLDRMLTILPHINLWQGYGMTEASSALTMLTDEDHRGGGPRLRSAGRPLFGVSVSIQDSQGRIVGPGENGEVCARGGNFMQGYWQQPEETDAAFRNGWYLTGDEGHVDADGYLYLVDRVKDMIVTGGENVYSIEVENALSTHPAVAEVAVIGIPHPTWGEQVHAIVVLHPGTEATALELQSHARKSIANYKVPKSIEFRTEPLPLSGALKPLKRDLRRPYWEHIADKPKLAG